jgi:5'-deoxynucleotidase YfbR-like HD superfamily hydrolase
LALLALSKKAVEMEEDIEKVKRDLQVLDMKVTYSFENLQEYVMDNVEKMVEQKFKKFREELRKEFRTSREKVNLREVKSQNDKVDYISAR